jgi:DNA-binding MurR/RpiR family transcriptional regulator
LSLLDSAPRRPRRGNGAHEDFFEELVRTLRRSNRLIDPAVLNNVAARLADARFPIHVIGGRSSHVVARHLVFHLHELRPYVRDVAHGVVPVYFQATDLGRRDTVVAFDFRRYERQTIEFCRQASDRGAAVALITDPWLSPIAEFARWVLPVEVAVPSPFDSSVSAMALVESLLADVAVRFGTRMRQRMARLEEDAGKDKVLGDVQALDPGRRKGRG